MRKWLLSLFVIFAVSHLRAACNEMSIYPQSKWKEIIDKVLTKARVDIDQDSQEEIIEIYRESGGEYLLEPVHRPRDFRDCGWFRIRIWKGEKLVANHSLNLLLNNNNNDDVSFRRAGAYRLIIEDFNKDQKPDFTIGLYSGPKTNKFKMFTIGPNGDIQLIPFVDSQGATIDWVLINDVRFSTDKFDRKGDLIQTQYATVGAGGMTSWKWNGTAFQYVSFKGAR